MPIDYNQYHPKWTLIRRLIMKRAKHSCELCGVPNYTVRRTSTKDGSYQISHYIWLGKHNYKDAKAHCVTLNEEADGEGKWSVVVLTIAHMDRDKKNNKFDNLKALCQRCHLKHDIHQHVANRKYGRNFKNNQIKLGL